MVCWVWEREEPGNQVVLHFGTCEVSSDSFLFSDFSSFSRLIALSLMLPSLAQQPLRRRGGDGTSFLLSSSSQNDSLTQVASLVTSPSEVYPSSRAHREALWWRSRWMGELEGVSSSLPNPSSSLRFELTRNVRFVLV